MKKNKLQYYIAVVLVVLLIGLFSETMKASHNRILETPPSGPYGGDVWALAFSPDYNPDLQQGYVLAGIQGDTAVYRLAAGENEWQPSAEGLSASYYLISDLAISPDGQAYLAIFNEGIYKLEDDGVTWISTDSPSKATDIEVLASGEVYASAYGGVYQWQGDSWERLTSTGLLNTKVRALEVTPAQDIWAGIYPMQYGDETGGVYRLPAGSSTWEHLDQGNAPTRILDLAVTESGNVWAVGSKGLEMNVFRLSLGSLNWEIVDLGDVVYGTSIAVAPQSEEVWIGTSSSLFRRISKDDIWQRLDAGLLGRRVRAVQDIVFAPDGNPWIATASGVYVLSDTRAIWEPLMNGMTELRINLLSVEQTGGVWSAGGGNVFRLNPGNTNWEDMSYDLPTGHMYNYSISAITTDKNGGQWVAPYQRGIFHLPAGETYWQEVIDQGLTVSAFGALTIDLEGGVWAGHALKYTDSLFYLAPEASRWITMNEILTKTTIVALETAPTGEVWVGAEQKIIRVSTNSTLLFWETIDTGWPRSTVIDMAATTTGDIWVSLHSFETQENELYHLSTGSDTWERDNFATGTRWLAASQNGDLWAVRDGTKDEVFYLPVGETEWQRLNWASDETVRSLAISSDGSALYLGVSGQGVVRLFLNTNDVYLPVICKANSFWQTERGNLQRFR